MVGRKKGMRSMLAEIIPTGKGTINNVITGLREQGVIAPAPASTETEPFGVAEVAAALFCGRLVQHVGLDPKQAATICAHAFEAETRFDRAFPDWETGQRKFTQHLARGLGGEELARENASTDRNPVSRGCMNLRELILVGAVRPDIFEAAGYHFVDESMTERLQSRADAVDWGDGRTRKMYPVMPKTILFYHAGLSAAPRGSRSCVWVERKSDRIVFGVGGGPDLTLAEYMRTVSPYWFTTTFSLWELIEGARAVMDERAP
jgi:hypothetical protein